MNQIGDSLIFVGPGTQPGSACPFYVWKMWDGQALVSAENCGAVSKCLNKGGDPLQTALVAPFLLPYTCEICNDEGTVFKTLFRKVEVNNPPTLASAPTIVPNNQAFPFQTQLQVVAYDLENNGVTPLWYANSEPVPGAVTTGPVAVPGTYSGNWIGANRNAYTSTLVTTVYSQGTVYSCKLVDGDMGTNALVLSVMGYEPGDPHFAIAAQPNSVTVDGSTLPDAVIAPGQTVNFTVYGYDSTAGNLDLVYTWYFYGSNRWDQPAVPIIAHGNTTALLQGSRNDYALDISGEVSAGLRTAIVTVTNSHTGRTATAALEVSLTKDLAPVMSGIRINDAITGADLHGVVTAAEAALVQFSGIATDGNDDAIVYRWDFVTPDLLPNYTLWGANVFVDITNWPSAVYSALGLCTPYDKYGQAGEPMVIPSLQVV